MFLIEMMLNHANHEYIILVLRSISLRMSHDKRIIPVPNFKIVSAVTIVYRNFCVKTSIDPAFAFQKNVLENFLENIFYHLIINYFN